MPRSPQIQLSDVSVARRARVVLSGLSLVLQPGVTGLLGRNGAGKTTLIRLLAGVQRPASGAVVSSERDIFGSARAMAEHRAELGWVPQGPGYPPGMRVDRFVEYAAWLKRIDGHERGSASSEAMASCNVEALAARRMGTLSGGERQRVVLAAAVVGDPGLLLLDEPTVGLDPAQRESYLSLMRVFGRTSIVLYSTHLVDDVVRTAQRVLVLDRGRVSHDIPRSQLDRPADEVSAMLRRAVLDSEDRSAG